ncbi:xylose isomerase-like protein [Emericellopsis atlantica]|uniref:Xylose isomerase-like protein n=1 Tax=Emericellopsis atlantica TaxID=2614577 RepID=A0A9P7ZEI6_9HYPO|nr:xylose isomerase-like protein [Emericellopsis atlantica]KAG9250342.1 xylose isomerase-like protein [Emericellopsis atlantica]
MSLGRSFAGHSLPYKLAQAKKHGFQGIEVFYEDLIDLTASMPGGETLIDNQLAAARLFRNLCEERGLEIMCLQPFMHFGGLIDREKQEAQIQDINRWIQLAHSLGTDLICFPSSFLPASQITADIDTIVNDLQRAADLGLAASPPVRFAYEALCWGTRISTWEDSWDLVQRVDRENFGICFDTFNIAGRIFADPAVRGGKCEDAEEATLQSLKRLVKNVDVKKVFLLQVADAERLHEPLDQHHAFYNSEQPARMSWSRNCRLFYGESSHGAYLPVKAVLTAVVRGLGFQGWLSFEVFNRRLTDRDTSVPEEMAKRASVAWEKMVREVPLDVRPNTTKQATPTPVQHRLSAML